MVTSIECIADLSQFATRLAEFLRSLHGKKYLTDVASAETLLRLLQSIPSPKAEPIKLWLANVGYERMQEMADPAKSLDRARETWQKHGRSEDRDEVHKAHVAMRQQ